MAFQAFLAVSIHSVSSNSKWIFLETINYYKYITTTYTDYTVCTHTLSKITQSAVCTHRPKKNNSQKNNRKMTNTSSPILKTYPLSNYSFHNTKPPKIDKKTNTALRCSHLQLNFKTGGRRQTVNGILVVHQNMLELCPRPIRIDPLKSMYPLLLENNHPHILLLKAANSYYKLPGGKLNSGENEIEGLKRKLTSQLAANQPAFQPDWQIGECLGMWCRPNFEKIMYPYRPAHITIPKECKKLYIVQLSEREYFDVRRNFNLTAVPLFELYDNNNRYGPVLASIPMLLSRFQLRAIYP